MAAQLQAVGEKLDERFEAAQEKLAEDPWGTSSRWLIESGIIMTVAGGVGWLVGDELTKGAQAADKDAGARIAFVGAVFTGAQNAQQVQNAGGGLEGLIGGIPIFGTLLGDVADPIIGTVSGIIGGVTAAATDITEIPQAIWAAAQVVPYLLWDGFAWAFGSGFGWIGTHVGPWLFGFGLLMIALGVGIRVTSERLFPRIELAFNARTAGFWNQFDERFHTRAHISEVKSEKATQIAVEKAVEKPEVVPSVIASEAPEPETPKSGSTGGSQSPPKAPEGPTPPPPASEQPPLSPEPPQPFPATPAETDEMGGTEEKPLPMGTPTSEIEAGLGGHHATEPTAEELHEQERNRRESHPEPEKLSPEQPSQLTDEEYWAEIDRIQAEA